MMNRRNFMKLCGVSTTAAASVALGAPIRILPQSKQEIPERTDPQKELWYLVIENIVPGSRVYVADAVTGEEFLNIKLIKSKDRIKIAMPKQMIDRQIVVRIRKADPPYKSLELNELNIGREGLNLFVNQQIDYAVMQGSYKWQLKP